MAGADKGKDRIAWEAQAWVDPVPTTEFCIHAYIDRDAIEMAPVIDEGKGHPCYSETPRPRTILFFIHHVCNSFKGT